MELMLVFLSTAIGTVAGVAVAMLMLQRKDRRPAMGADSILRTQLQNTEWALASAGRDVEDLRKQLAERDQAAQGAAAELESAVQRLLACSAESEALAKRSAEAERLASEAAAQAEALAERVRQLEAAGASAEEGQRRSEALEAELDGLRSQVGAEKTALQAELGAVKERAAELASEMAAILSVRAALEAALRMEREAAAEGMELLQKAQGKFCAVVQKAPLPAATDGSSPWSGSRELCRINPGVCHRPTAGGDCTIERSRQNTTKAANPAATAIFILSPLID